MKKIFSIILALPLLFALSGCGVKPGSSGVEQNPTKTISAEEAAVTSPTPIPSSSGGTGSSTPETRTEVIWADYSPGLQSEIDQMTQSGDCRGIETFFGMAVATEEKMKATAGHGNEAFTAYLNEALVLAKCG
ncbi:lipoprotein [Aurantimicrobium minutum]|uniref:Uncharacterized protein n=1 Tax=Aurantimicrobium minutum TaxID=708131 RepID=A0A173LV53_9MICO|nr:hypothetical protein [Aurantimicrobium minutum]BAU98700.1 Uncharacterized protein AUMI_11580 [Aurantimicrobium minutum]